jgi:3'(2'), 5'-bisphosphate nucleotidase
VPSRELAAAVDLCRRACALVLDHYARAPVVRWKGRNDPVTDADEAVTRFILGELGAAFPDDAVLIEERADDGSRRRAARAWIVDPLDGTAEFIARNGEFAVMIGLAEGGRPVAGAVGVPCTGAIYYGAAGEGAYVARGEEAPRPIVAPAAAGPAQRRLRMAVSRSHRSPRIDEVKALLGGADEIPCGSVGLKMLAVVSGEADLYVHFGRGAKLWDACAPDAVAAAAGVLLTDLAGAPIDYAAQDVALANGIVVAAPPLHGRVVAALRTLAPS